LSYGYGDNSMKILKKAGKLKNLDESDESMPAV
jgi:hypothetical protein